MIEVVYKEEKKKPVGNEGFFDIPKNIRQIGEADDDFKIYIEDYAYHYLDRIADELSGGRVALLLGKSNWAEGVTYIFIRSAFVLEGMEADTSHIPLKEDVWGKADTVMETYFQNQDVVGWFFTMPECDIAVSEVMYRTHMNYFAGNDKVFFMMEPMDKDEGFFRYENGKMVKQKGYYLYYERNDAMQEFMIDHNHNMPMESGEIVRDKAVKDFREIISRKNEERENEPVKKNTSGFMYASTAAAILLTLVLGSNYLNNYDKMKNAQGVVEEVTAQLDTEIATSTPEITESATVTETPELIESPEATKSPEISEEQLLEEQPPAKTPQPVAADLPDSVEITDEEVINSQLAQDTRTYTIKEGDTLTSICQSIYGNINMIETICKVNNISIDTIIYPGETILLP